MSLETMKQSAESFDSIETVTLYDGVEPKGELSLFIKYTKT